MRLAPGSAPVGGYGHGGQWVGPPGTTPVAGWPEGCGLRAGGTGDHMGSECPPSFPPPPPPPQVSAQRSTIVSK